MNTSQIIQIVSMLGSAIGGIFVSKGLLTSDQLTTIVGALGTMIAAGITIWATLPRQQISAAAKLPQVATVSLHDPALAQSIPAQNVVPAPQPPSSLAQAASQVAPKP